MFSYFSTHRPSARCVPAANAVYKSIQIFLETCLNLNNSKSFSFFPPPYFFCMIVSVRILADSVIGSWRLFNSSRKQIIEVNYYHFDPKARCPVFSTLMMNIFQSTCDQFGCFHSLITLRDFGISFWVWDNLIGGNSLNDQQHYVTWEPMALQCCSNPIFCMKPCL
jgi:hypothetical protein